MQEFVKDFEIKDLRKSDDLYFQSYSSHWLGNATEPANK